MLVHLGNLSHFVVTQREVEDVDILRHTFLMARLRNGYDAALCEPTEGYLSSRLVMLCSDSSQ